MALESRDHRYYRLTIDGRLILKTKVSTGTKHQTVSDSLIGLMARQLHTTAPNFRKLEACTYSKLDYLEDLKKQGVLE